MNQSRRPLHDFSESAGTASRHRVVIVGGGFGGLSAARGLRNVDVDITLVDRRNFHLFQPLLYQVATGGLSPAHIASPIRSVLRRQKNCSVRLAEVVDFDPAGQRVVLGDGDLRYDSLIVAAGSSHSYFGHNEWAALAPGLKTIEDATEMRRRILYAFERAEWETDAAVRKSWMTFVVVGGGPTGVELAGALSEIARHTLRRDFRHIDPAEAHLVLVDAGERVISQFPADLSERALHDLRRLHVEVRTQTYVTNIEEGTVTLTRDGHDEHLPCYTVLWAAGVQASPLARKLADASHAQLDRAGRLIVGPDCSVPDHPGIFVVGDMAHYTGDDGHALPGVAPVAMQQATHVAAVIRARVEGSTPPAAFRYHDRGSMATIGRSRAVAQVGRMKFKGWLAWMMWLFVHLMQLVQFANRVTVLFQWAYSYVTYNRTARLITGKTLPVKTKVAPVGDAVSIGAPEESEASQLPAGTPAPGEPGSTTRPSTEPTTTPPPSSATATSPDSSTR